MIFKECECEVWYKQKKILAGKAIGPGGLWILPIDGRESLKEKPRAILQNPPSFANATVYMLPYKQQKVKYMHQTFFVVPAPTLVKTITNKQLLGFPYMNLKDIRRHLPTSLATRKGRMKKPREGIRSTRKNSELVNKTQDNMQDMHPTDGVSCSDNVQITNNIFCFAALADKEKGKVYTDATGALPIISLKRKQYYIVAYDYNNNYINAVPVSDLKDATIVDTIKTIFETMEEKGHRPCFNVTDNQAAKPLKAYLKTKDCKWQFVEPHNHRVNAEERAIQLFKNHMISRLCCIDSEWPLQLWDKLTEQGLITLNLCRTSRKHPDKSAFHSYHGHCYNWKKHPMAPPAQELWSIRHWTTGHRGDHEAWTHGIAARCLIIIET